MKITYAISVLFLVIVLLGSCSQDKDPEKKYADRLVTENHSVMSPSQEYSLEIAMAKEDNVRGFHFIVRNAMDNDEIFKCEDFYRLRDVSFLFWGDDDTIWLYNGDVGTFYWEKPSESEEWIKKDYAENKDTVTVPEMLKELRPKYFN